MADLLACDAFTSSFGPATDGLAAGGPGANDPATYTAIRSSFNHDSPDGSIWASTGTTAASGVNTTQADFEVQIEVKNFGTIGGQYAGVAFRAIDIDNYLLAVRFCPATGNAGNLRLYEVVAGVTTLIADLTGVMFVNGDTIKVVGTGTTIETFKNGASVDSRTVTALSTATIHGFIISAVGNQVARLDNYYVYGVASRGWQVGSVAIG